MLSLSDQHDLSVPDSCFYQAISRSRSRSRSFPGFTNTLILVVATGIFVKKYLVTNTRYVNLFILLNYFSIENKSINNKNIKVKKIFLNTKQLTTTFPIPATVVHIPATIREYSVVKLKEYSIPKSCQS